MSAKPVTASEKTLVILLRMGVGKQEFELPEGTTLADLLRSSGIDPESHALFIDGKPLAESLVLHPGMIVSALPKPASERTGDDWRGSVGFFSNDPAFNEMLQVMNTEREAEKVRP
jgi:sulfur carrier protein ThiS